MGLHFNFLLRFRYILLHILLCIKIKINKMESKQLPQWSDKIKLGSIQLKNRIVMPALTRQRCGDNGVPNEMVAEYYAQRAGAAIIITETVAWCQRGRSSTGSGNLFTEQQAEGWKKVTDKVHANNGRIFVQINHAGRATNTDKTGGLQVWAPSAIGCREKVRYLGGQVGPVPHQMTLEEIQQTKKEFRQSMRLAKKAGFDGIQLQGAHGYLIDQFLRSCSNTRTDIYGGSVQNRSRFCLELFDIACQFFEPWQVGVRVTPVSRAKDMFDEFPEKTFGYLLAQLSKRGSGIVQLRQSTQPYNFVNNYGVTSKDQIQNVCKTFRSYFNGIIIGNDSFNAETGLAKIRSGDCDMISFGQLYIGNPDLAQRIINGYEINTKLDKSTFYGNAHGPKGYLDYPRYSSS